VGGYSFFVFGITNKTIIETDIESQFTDAFGEFDLGYVKMFVIWGPAMLILLGLASVHYPGIGIIGSSLWVALLSLRLELTSPQMEINLSILFGLLLLLGFIRLITKRRQDEGGDLG
jgi:hypothetical protein